VVDRQTIVGRILAAKISITCNHPTLADGRSTITIFLYTDICIYFVISRRGFNFQENEL
jgi:hypothetical protein